MSFTQYLGALPLEGISEEEWNTTFTKNRIHGTLQDRLKSSFIEAIQSRAKAAHVSRLAAKHSQTRFEQCKAEGSIPQFIVSAIEQVALKPTGDVSGSSILTDTNRRMERIMIDARRAALDVVIESRKSEVEHFGRYSTPARVLECEKDFIGHHFERVTEIVPDASEAYKIMRASWQFALTLIEEDKSLAILDDQERRDKEDAKRLAKSTAKMDIDEPAVKGDTLRGLVKDLLKDLSKEGSSKNKNKREAVAPPQKKSKGKKPDDDSNGKGRGKRFAPTSTPNKGGQKKRARAG